MQTRAAGQLSGPARQPRAQARHRLHRRFALSYAEASRNRTTKRAYVTRTNRSAGKQQPGCIAGDRVGATYSITGETMRPLFNALLLALPLAFSSLASAADSPAGRWQTIDDETGKPKSIVEIQ